MKKNLKLIISIGLLIAIVFIAWIINSYFYQNNFLIIKTKKGNVKINNFYKNLNNKSGDDVSFITNNDYYIYYYSKDKSFTITILNPDIHIARERAEKDLLSALGIDKNEACLLNVLLTVPYSVNSQASGSNYGLSFCPNSIAFPK